MRVPRVRFTLRRMMVAVVVVAMVLGFSMSWMRFIRREKIRAAYQRKAAYHAMMEKDMYLAVSIIEKYASTDDKKRGRSYRGEAQRHAKLKRKYERAAAHPMESIPPPGWCPWNVSPINEI